MESYPPPPPLRIVAIVADPDMPLYVRKTLGSGVCSLAAAPGAALRLGSAGAVGALHDLQAASAAVRRQKVVAPSIDYTSRSWLTGGGRAPIHYTL